MKDAVPRAKKTGRAKKKVARMLPNASVSMQIVVCPRHVEAVGSGTQVDPRVVIQGSLCKTTCMPQWSKHGRYRLSATLWLQGPRARRNQAPPRHGKGTAMVPE